MNRRHFVIFSSTILFSGCGFKLRGTEQYYPNYVFLKMNTNSYFGNQIKRRVQSELHAEVVDNPESADVIISILSSRRSKDDLTYNDYGKLRDQELNLSYKVRIETPDGKELLKDTWFHTRDTYPYSRTRFLSREHEDKIMFRSMENEIVNQIMNCIHNIQIK